VIIGLTGGIATGKSTVSQMFRERGAAIIDADMISRQVVEPGTEGLAQVVAHFGQQVLDEEGRLNRPVLASIIFRNEERREKLNSILHPLIRREMIERTNKILKDDPDKIVIWDVPLLYEGKKMTQFVEKIIVVYVPESIQLKRLMLRNSLTGSEARSRIQAQMSIEEKRKLADFIIDNSGSLSETERQVDRLWNYLTSRSG
jgi:dephospho-CoA kinase